MIGLPLKQMPLYPTTIFQGDTDGEGMNIVLYFKLSDNYSKELPLHFQESVQVKSICIIFYGVLLMLFVLNPCVFFIWLVGAEINR